jgi:hypothetical protein
MPGAGCDIDIFPPVQPFVGGFRIFAWEPFCHRIAQRANVFRHPEVRAPSASLEG